MSTTVGSPVSPVNDSRLIRSPFVLNFEKAFGDYGELFFNGGDKKNKLLYDLYAIVNHSGNTEAGHYTASIHHKG